MNHPRHMASPSASGGTAPQEEPAGDSDFDLLTYADLGREIQQAEARANNPAKKAAWRNLWEVVSRAAGAVEAVWDPAVGTAWNLVSLEAEGFQGSTLPLTVQFDPTPGITIFHGPNGAGKSTIADGIRTALSGRTDWWAAVTPGKTRSGKTPLWEKVNCARDSETATVKVTLTRANEKLHLTSRLGKDGIVYEVSANNVDENGHTDVDIAATSWPYAVEGYPPVFSYADIERRVQQHEDLQKYIKNLLALGGCFDYLDGRVTELSLAASESRKRLSAAQKAAKLAVDSVDSRFRERNPSIAVKEIEWPDTVQDMTRWLTDNDLLDGNSQLPEVTDTSLKELSESLQAVDRAIEELHGEYSGVRHRLAGALSAMHTELQSIHDPGYVCPVCDSPTDDWVERLRNNVADAETLMERRTAVAAALTRLRNSLPEIRSAVEVLTGSDNVSDSIREFVRDVSIRESEITTAFETHGLQPVGEVTSSFLRLRDVIFRKEWEEASSTAVELSNFTRQWQRSRRAALDSYIALWTEENDSAQAAPLWEATRKCIGELSDKLMKARASRFEGRAGLQVRKLLEDAGISIDSLNLTRTRAEIGVQGADGRAIELAMLSAGQRNAFLLAPLFATADVGPFGFLVLDDPVHSFDEIRVDRLAAVIADLSTARRVIVLTHDERLKEHLLARSPQCEALAVSRDPIKGEVSIEPTDELWRVLIRDAEAVWRWSPKASTTGYLTESQIIRGLLRQALDDALRQCVVKYSLKFGSSVSAAVEKLDTGMTTQKRLDLAREIISLPSGTDHPVDNALKACGHHVPRWNNAAHGNNENKADLKLEIKAGMEACVYLGEFSF